MDATQLSYYHGCDEVSRYDFNCMQMYAIQILPFPLALFQCVIIGFPMDSHHVLTMSFNTFSITPFFLSICFGKCCVLFTYKNGQKKRTTPFFFGDCSIITNLTCDKLIMKIVQSSFIHIFVHFAHEYHVLKTQLTHG
jgi:hypothetical protein